MSDAFEDEELIMDDSTPPRNISIHENTHLNGLPPLVQRSIEKLFKIPSEYRTLLLPDSSLPLQGLSDFVLPSQTSHTAPKAKLYLAPRIPGGIPVVLPGRPGLHQES